MISRLILFCTLGLWIAHAAETPSSHANWLRPENHRHARVVEVEDPRAVFAFDPDAEVVATMVNRGLLALTGKSTASEAWRSLVSTQDTVGLKVFSAPGAASGTRPVVVAAVVKELLEAGLAPSHIVIWDKRLSDLRQAGYVDLGRRLGVDVVGSTELGYDGEVTPYETPLLGRLVWGDYEFGKSVDNMGRKSYLSKLLTHRLTKIINITPLANHNLAQVSGNLYSLAMGSVDNTLRFEAGSDASSLLSQAVPEIYALPQLGDRVVLNIVDALICQYQGEEQTLLHYSTMLCQLRFSTDPVALDVLSVQELERARQAARVPPVKVSWQLFTNASLLELGVSDRHLIDVVKIGPTASAER